MTRTIWFRHLLLGIPLAAFLHSALQFAYAYSPNLDNDWGFFPIHWAAGMIVGSLILAPAFTLQAFVAVWLSRKNFSAGLQVLSGGLVQATLVALWAHFVGIEPSLSGNFQLTMPMIAAGFLSGAVVTNFAAPNSAEQTKSTSAAVEDEVGVFGYRRLRAFMLSAAVICFVSGIVLAILLRESSPDPVVAFCACVSAALFCWCGARLMAAEVRVGKISIVWTRGRRKVAIPWSHVREVRSSSFKLSIRSEHASIDIDKQLDDFGSLSELVRKYAPPLAWQLLHLPLRCRASMLVPGILCSVGAAWIGFMWWVVDYSPPADTTEWSIVIVMTSLVGFLVPYGLYLATFRCEFEFGRFRIGTALRRKEYEVSDIADIRMTTVNTAELMPRYRGGITPPLTVQQIEFRFKDGAKVNPPAKLVAVDFEALYELLRSQYISRSRFVAN